MHGTAHQKSNFFQIRESFRLAYRPLADGIQFRADEWSTSSSGLAQAGTKKTCTNFIYCLSEDRDLVDLVSVAEQTDQKRHQRKNV